MKTVTHSERNEMSHRKHGLRALGLSLAAAALGLMAFSAVAQAESFWLVLGSKLGAGGSKQVGIVASEDLRLLITKPKATVLCKKVVLEDGLISNVGSGSTEVAHGTGTLEFTECKVEPSTCTVHEPIIAEVLAHAFLHTDKHTYLLFQPSEKQGGLKGFFTKLKILRRRMRPAYG